MTPSLASLAALVLAALLLAALALHRRAVRRAVTDARSLVESAAVGSAVLDPAGRLLDPNPALARMVGRAPADLQGRSVAALVAPADVATLRDAVAALHDGVVGALTAEVACRHADGSLVPAAVHAAALPGGAGRVVLQLVDMTASKRAEARLRQLADHDALTGLLNRRRFEEELDRHVARARRYGAEGAVLLLDVDRFKLVNDTLGHAAGDLVIAGVADALRASLRATDTVARLGGDEFAILLPKADRGGAETVAGKLVAAVRARCADDATALGVATSISVGVAPLDERSIESPAGLVAEADRAMYGAKRAGGDRFAVAGDAHGAASLALAA